MTNEPQNISPALFSKILSVLIEIFLYSHLKKFIHTINKIPNLCFPFIYFNNLKSHYLNLNKFPLFTAYQFSSPLQSTFSLITELLTHVKIPFKKYNVVISKLPYSISEQTQLLKNSDMFKMRSRNIILTFQNSHNCQKHN